MDRINAVVQIPLAFILLSILLFSGGCKEDQEPELKSDNGYFQVLITEEAGSFSMTVDENEVDSIENYLPLPLSFGHFSVSPIDSLNTRTQINAFVLSASAHAGDVEEILPIAVYKMLDGDEVIPLILAVPVSEKERLINATTYFELQRECFTCKSLFENWLTNLPAYEERVFVGWENEQQAEKLLEEYAELE